MAQVLLPEGLAPSTPGTGVVSLYAKSDGNLYQKDDAGIETSLVSIPVPPKANNLIIGGDFSVNPWQRGSTFTAVANAAYTADRWFLTSAATTGAVSVLKTLDAPTVAQAGVFTQHCLHVDVTTADASIAAGDAMGIAQRIEGYNIKSSGFGQTGTRFITLSFWHKHTKVGTNCVRICNSATSRSYVAEYTQAVTDTWEKATITFPVDTTGTWLYDNGIGLEVFFTLAGGTTFQTTANTWQPANYIATTNQVNNLDNTANNFKIALVQLESGSTASSFEDLPIDTVVSKCRRYYYRLVLQLTGQRYGVGFASSSTQATVLIFYKVSLRSPSLVMETTGVASDYSVAQQATNITLNVAPTFSSSTTECAVLNISVTSGLTPGDGLMLRSNNGSAGFLGWDAEL